MSGNPPHGYPGYGKTDPHHNPYTSVHAPHVVYHESNGQYDHHPSVSGRATGRSQHEEERENRPAEVVPIRPDYNRDCRDRVGYMRRDGYPHKVIEEDWAMYNQLNRDTMDNYRVDIPSTTYARIEESHREDLRASRLAGSSLPARQIVIRSLDMPPEFVDRSGEFTTPAPHHRGPEHNEHPSSVSMERGNGTVNRVHRRGQRHHHNHYQEPSS
ncbi:hypothetical protein K440DRAFT_658809 [Wilcoxina mikolae CBS 423.85]|nr:hypothetical protein K440DRAFT_658809 [Wilcoxina mikolae CBS 423.85]